MIRFILAYLMEVNNQKILAPNTLQKFLADNTINRNFAGIVTGNMCFDSFNHIRVSVLFHSQSSSDCNRGSQDNRGGGGDGTCIQ